MKTIKDTAHSDPLTLAAIGITAYVAANFGQEGQRPCRV